MAFKSILNIRGGRYGDINMDRLFVMFKNSDYKHDEIMLMSYPA